VRFERASRAAGRSLLDPWADGVRSPGARRWAAVPESGRPAGEALRPSDSSLHGGLTAGVPMALTARLRSVRKAPRRPPEPGRELSRMPSLAAFPTSPPRPARFSIAAGPRPATRLPSRPPDLPAPNPPVPPAPGSPAPRSQSPRVLRRARPSARCPAALFRRPPSIAARPSSIQRRCPPPLRRLAPSPWRRSSRPRSIRPPRNARATFIAPRTRVPLDFGPSGRVVSPPVRRGPELWGLVLRGPIALRWRSWSSSGGRAPQQRPRSARRA
jgi:hypothetical protein